jgi:hypothetical protein
MTDRKKTFSAIEEPDDPIAKEKLARATPLEEANLRGVGSQESEDYDVPELNLTSNERAIRKGNAVIKLGKDRHSNRFSGTGGKGQSHCAAIDIVAGNLGFIAKSRDSLGRKLYVDPDFKLDAARIYMSQKSNVDSYFGLKRPKGGGSTSDGYLKSTIALKADTVRIISRESIRLVTRTDSLDAQGGELSNADQSGYGIDLIAMNDPSDLQPMVKGNNLVECLDALHEMIENVATLLNNFVTYQQQFNIATQTHTHMSPFFGTETAPDFKQIMGQGIQNNINTALNVQVPMIAEVPLNSSAIVSDYLDNAGCSSDKFILSKYNRTN